MLSLVILLNFFAFSLGALTHHEQTWMNNNPSVTNHNLDEERATKKLEFESHGHTDVNLFREFFRWSQEHNHGSWETFSRSTAYEQFNAKQSLIQSLVTRGYADSRWHSSFFGWSQANGNSQDISRWTNSDEFRNTEKYFEKLQEATSAGYNEDEFGYYWGWYQNHKNDESNGISDWRNTLSFREMRAREELRNTLTSQGYADNLWFRHCWAWIQKHPHKNVADWEASYDYSLLKYREDKRAELISHGYLDRAQFNSFWRWFVLSPAYVDPAQPYVISGSSGSQTDRWNNRKIASETNTVSAKCRCVSAVLSKGLSVCHQGCGNPNKVCDENFGCTDIQKACDNDKCTCKPNGLQGSDYSFTECEQQCNRLGMYIPWNLAGVLASAGTGCNTNSAVMWVSPYNAPVVPTAAPTIRPATQRYTIDGGMTRYWDTKTARYHHEEARCRCVNADNTQGISVCTAGREVCNTSHGCSRTNTNSMCKCRADPNTDVMTYSKCAETCELAGMRVVSSNAGVDVTQNTGCNTNGRRMWVDWSP